MAKKELYDPEILRKVARWYHDDFLLKKEMRTRLRNEYDKEYDDRALDRMLVQAAEGGVVRISYPPKPPGNRFAEALIRKYPHLIKVITVPFDPDADLYDDLLAMWGHAAARYFDEILLASDSSKPLHVGLSGGETLMAFAMAVREQKRPRVHIHTLALIGRGEGGEPYNSQTHVDPLVNAQILFGKCGKFAGHCHYATVPPYEAENRNSLPDELRQLARRDAIGNVIKGMDQVTVAFAGLGMIRGDMRPDRTNQISMTGLVASMVSPQQLQSEQAAGDLAYNFFDRDGNNLERAQFFLTAGWFDKARQGVDFYRSMVDERRGKVIVIAGHDKELAIRAGLKGKLFNCFITDSTTAEALLDD